MKTPQCDEATAREKAVNYRPQQDVYVTAAEEIGGMQVGRFAFQFSRANVQVSDPVDPIARERARSTR